MNPSVQNQTRSGAQGTTLNKKKKQPGQVIDLGPKPKTRNRKNVVKAVKQELAYRIPECVGHYFSAAINPFDTPAGACVPADLFPLPSSKVKVFSRGRMTIGTGGIGFATACPTAMSDIAFLQTTTAATVGAPGSTFLSFTNLQNIACGQLPYAQADFTPSGSLQWRPVALGLRVKYVGQLMDRNGVCIGYENPDHQEWRDESFNSLNSNPYTEVSRVGSEEWDMSICSSGPVQPRELEFASDTYLTNNGNCYMAIAVSGVAGDIYEVEAFQHIEYIGTKVVNKTKSHADAQLFGKVVETLKGGSVDKPLQPQSAPSLWERFKKAVKDNLPALVETSVGAAGALLTKSSNPLLLDGGTKLLGNALPTLLGGGTVAQPRLTRTQAMIMA